jgi:hypothetical protein
LIILSLTTFGAYRFANSQKEAADGFEEARAVQTFKFLASAISGKTSAEPRTIMTP